MAGNLYAELVTTAFSSINDLIDTIYGIGLIDFGLATDPVSFWILAFDGEFSGNVTMAFAYDENSLPFTPQEQFLEVYHFESTGWTQPTGPGTSATT